MKTFIVFLAVNVVWSIISSPVVSLINRNMTKGWQRTVTARGLQFAILVALFVFVDFIGLLKF